MILICVLLAIAGKALSRFFFHVSNVLSEKEQEERFYKEALLNALSSKESERAPDPIEGLLKANQELIEKKQVQSAIEDELGIKMH
jgi:hypothetical protein